MSSPSLAVATNAPADEVNLAWQEIDPTCRRVLSAAEAWDSLVLPLRREDGVLVCATAVETLPAAAALLEGTVDEPVRFVLAECRPLEQFIAEQYGYEGVEIDEAA